MKKTVLITGASKGIGYQTAIEFAKKGYNIILNYLSDDKSSEKLKKHITENYDVDVLNIKTDVSDENAVKAMVDYSFKHFGSIDVLVNNAGICNDSEFNVKKIEDFKKVVNVNLIGPFIVSREVSKYMLEKKDGVIINVTSTDAIDTNYVYGLDYDASKAGLISLTHNLSKYLSPKIRVNAVAAGWVNTDMNKSLDKEFIKEECEKIYLNRFANPKEIAKVIVFLSSNDASYINNEVIRVDGGCNHG